MNAIERLIEEWEFDIKMRNDHKGMRFDSTEEFDQYEAITRKMEEMLEQLKAAEALVMIIR